MLCFLLAAGLFVAGIYSGRTGSRAQRDLLERYQLYRNSNISAFAKQGSGIVVNGSYVLPGNRVVHYLSRDKAIPFEVAFLPSIANGDTLQWQSNVSKDVGEGGMRGKFDYYRGVPWDMKKVGTGPAQGRPSTVLSFTVEKNPHLVGKELSYRIVTGDSETMHSIRVSNPVEFRQRLDEATGDNPGDLIGVAFFIGALMFVWLGARSAKPAA